MKKNDNNDNNNSEKINKLVLKFNDLEDPSIIHKIKMDFNCLHKYFIILCFFQNLAQKVLEKVNSPNSAIQPKQIEIIYTKTVQNILSSVPQDISQDATEEFDKISKFTVEEWLNKIYRGLYLAKLNFFSIYQTFQKFQPFYSHPSLQPMAILMEHFEPLLLPTNTLIKQCYSKFKTITNSDEMEPNNDVYILDEDYPEAYFMQSFIDILQKVERKK